MPQTIRSTVGDYASPSIIAERWPLWAVLIAVAVGGSCLYGASLSWTLPAWRMEAGAAWLALSAGLAWLLFIPTLAAVTHRPLALIFEASLLTMAGGELVLTSGAVANALLGLWNLTAHAVALNLAIVGLSNLVMAALLAALLRAEEVPVWRTVATWLLVLNGSGAAFFALLYPLLHTP